MQLIFLTLVLLPALIAAGHDDKCPKDYRKANLFFGKRYLKNYFYSADPNNGRKGQDALMKKNGQNLRVPYRWRKGRAAKFIIEAKGYRADVKALEFCLETKCVRNIELQKEGQYAPLMTTLDASGNPFFEGDIGTALSVVQKKIHDSSKWTKKCFPGLGHISKMTLTVKPRGRQCKPMVRNMFLRACKKRKPEPAVCIYKDGRIYNIGDTWDITDEVEGSCGASCTCNADGNESCISTACPPNTCYYEGKLYKKGDMWTPSFLGPGCSGNCECKGTALVECSAVC